MGARARLGGVVHGRARPAGRRDRAEHDPARSRGVDRAAGVDGQRLHADVRGAADDRGRPGRQLRAPAAVRRRAGAVRGGLGGVGARGGRGPAGRGAGRALVLPIALPLLNAAFPPERRGWAMGIFGGVTGLAALVGPVLGGAITQGIAWPWIFWVNVPIGVLAIPLVLVRVQESYGPRVRLDVPGLAFGTGAALGLVWGLVRGNSAGWGSPEVVAALAGGVLLLAAFVAWGPRGPAPLLPMRLFRSRAFSAGNAAIFYLNASLTGAVFFMAQFLQTALGQGPRAAGLRLLPWGVAPFLIAPRAGALADRIGERPLIVSGLLLQTAGRAWVAGGARPGPA